MSSRPSVAPRISFAVPAVLLAWSLLLPPASISAGTRVGPRALAAQEPAAGDPADEALEAILDRWQELRDGERPDDGLRSVTEETRARRLEGARELLDRLETEVEAEALSGQARITYRVFQRSLQSELEAAEHDGHLIPFTSDGGFHTELARLPASVSIRSVDDYESYLTRLHDVPRYIREHVALLEEGLETGFTQPRIVVERILGPVRAQVVEAPEGSAFFAPLQELPPTIPEAEREEMRRQGRAVVADSVLPAWRELLAFLEEEYLPGTRTSIGALELPGGDAYYEYLVRDYTTLEMTPGEVHRTGLEEVKRIRAQMDAIIDTLGFQGDFQAFLDFLRTDPRFYAETPEEILKEAALIAKRVDGRLPELFHVRSLPRMPYGVEPVPDDIAPGYTSGRYVAAREEAGRGGTYWVNTYKLDSRTLYTLPALTLHEAVPGHHLQIASADELQGLHPFRRSYYSGAYQEGWGLYSERLGLELGVYEDPYDDFGRLTYEMWRACRLVVDTGIHAMGWSRQEAVDYMARNTALSLHEVGTEIDRYISWPGQALGYKMGELTILRLREQAEETLGADFDVRDFHGAVLENGPLPLTVLEDVVRKWIEEESASEGS